MRELAIALLEDEQGICESGYIAIEEMLSDSGDLDLLEQVNYRNGRYSLET